MHDRQHGNQEFHSLANFLPAASAARMFSIESHGKSGAALTTASTSRTMSVYRISPARKRATATSSAALSTAVFVPPARAASFTRRNAGKRASSGDLEEPREEEARKAQLEDADLEMLAAAEGEESFFNPNPHLAHKPGRSGGDLLLYGCAGDHHLLMSAQTLEESGNKKASRCHLAAGRCFFADAEWSMDPQQFSSSRPLRISRVSCSRTAGSGLSSRRI